MEHTKGPWRVMEIQGQPFVQGNEVAGVVAGREYKREILSDEAYPKKRADCQLIAAAPDLLEALDGAAMVFRMWYQLPEQAQGEVMQKTLMYAEKAIAKAKGK